MCYRVSVRTTVSELEHTFQAKVHEPELFQSYYHVSGFQKPFLPVIQIPGVINMLQWRSHEKYNSLNARSESIYEKVAFKRFAGNRCLVLTTGFFEHRDFNKKKYPYFIKPKNSLFFALGAIVSDYFTLSILTTDANPMMQQIHNSASRMPLIIPEDKYSLWLQKDLTREESTNLMVPFLEEKMEAYTCSTIITKKGANTNCEEAVAKVVYPELENQNPLTLF